MKPAPPANLNWRKKRFLPKTGKAVAKNSSCGLSKSFRKIASLRAIDGGKSRFCFKHRHLSVPYF